MENLLTGLDLQSTLLMVFEAMYLPWLMLDKKNLTPFAARKLCHAGSGIVMMFLNCDVLLCRIFIYLSSMVSLVMNWEVFPSIFPNFWFGTARDKGITLFLVLVSLWVYLGLPLRVLGPVFLADPAGAVVGKYMSTVFPKGNKKWIGSKTLAGSVAVFVVTFASLYSPRDPLTRGAVALLATLGEALGGAYDNLVIALVVVAFSGYV